MKIPIYKSEVQDGLAEAFEQNSIVICSQLKPSDVDKAKFAEGFAELIKTEAGEQIDLYPLTTILVSTGWNKNTDVFDKYETWAARKSPVDKPLNIGHDHSKVRGHIKTASVVDENYKAIADDSALDDVPNFFHILTEACLYKVWKPDDIQNEMNQIIAEIEAGDWCVSMECLFKGFDYGFIDKDGSHKIVPRTEATAFLTKYLRAYGGVGEYEGRRLGRVLRNITFSGKGLVKNPANPYSIIITDKFAGAAASIDDIGDKMSKETVTDVDKFAEKLESLTVSVAETTAKLANSETENKNLKDSVAKAEAAKKVAEDKLVSVEAKVASLESNVTELSKANEGLIKDRDTALEKLNKIEAEAKKTSRLAAIKEKGKTPEEAEALYTKFETLDDKTFAEVVSLLVKPAVEKPIEKGAEGSELENKTETVVTVPADDAQASEAVLNELREFLKSNTK